MSAKAQFNDYLLGLYEKTKSLNNLVFPIYRYERLVAEIKVAKINELKHEKTILKHYDVLPLDVNKGGGGMAAPRATSHMWHMSSWRHANAENFEPPTFVKGTTDKWEGEDEEDVKDTWEELGDENEEKEKEEGKKDDEEGDGVRAFQRKKKKKMVNIIAEKEAKEKAEEEEEKKEEKNPKTPEDVFQEKLRKQRLQEEADLADGVGQEFPSLKSEEPEPWAMSLESKEDFDAFQKSLVSQLEKHTKSPLLVPFLEELMREISIGLTAEDVKKLGGTLNAIHAEKLKAAKSKAKKKGKAKVSLKVGKDQDEYGYVGGELDNEYDDFI
ncbi:unnamed protein product [Darwinula stevensoni]|uniref:EIF3j n=1 Tax=Darwinula stevensoni TaxID=69355 RepID=A0A7R9A0Z4_9CRUS|nr:unnamed protein product [Darwinula stevensoni]CAG0886647.1 unnamed protein product [Darwinula stevensoni]